MNKLFSQLSLRPELQKSLTQLGYVHMTPSQEKSLEAMLAQKDVIVQAKTGSGKTAAFALSVLSRLDVHNTSVQAIVLCPTRELSEQVLREIRRLACFIPNTKTIALCGGSSAKAQAASLSHGVHCIVGTPGRVLDHMRRGHIDLNGLNTFVLDEADRMLDMGFLPDIKKITQQLPTTRQTLLFSATYQKDIEEISTAFQKQPLRITIDTAPETLDITHFACKKNGVDDLDLIEKLFSKFKPQSVLIFCNTKQQCKHLTDQLHERGQSVLAIHGDLEQKERDEALIQFSNQSVAILVATDVAARGIDIHELSLVINYDLATDKTAHLHRIGRTARADHSGNTVSFYRAKEEACLKTLASAQQRDFVILSNTQLQAQQNRILTAQMATIRISCGRKNKLRARDILGALTADKEIQGGEVGTITLWDTRSFVAITRQKIETALRILSNKKVKGRMVRVQQL